MRVQNLTSANGNKIANQFEIFADGAKYFQSYNSIIVKSEMIAGRRIVTLDKFYWNYSRTTAKYRNLFLNETTAQTEAKIKSGEYVLTDLN